ncbi:hypothetical protein PO124_18785 [Bacillus licheniformis]|nr:hypothetical protein [Bacillus licheniformis]
MYVHPCFIKWFALLYIALNAAHEGLLSWNGHAAPAAAVAGLGLVKQLKQRRVASALLRYKDRKAIIFRV